MKFQGYYLRFEVTIDFYDRVICLANRVERTFHVTFEKLLLLPRCWVPGQVRVADKFEGYRSPDIYDALVGFCSLVFTGGNKYTRVYLSKLENTSSVSSTPEFHGCIRLRVYFQGNDGHFSILQGCRTSFSFFSSRSIIHIASIYSLAFKLQRIGVKF